MPEFVGKGNMEIIKFLPFLILGNCNNIEILHVPCFYLIISRSKMCFTLINHFI